MHAQRLAVVLSGALVVAAASWAWSAPTAPPPLRAPSVDRPAVERTAARAPRIAAFDAFAINDLNPFVPWWERIEVTGARGDDGGDARDRSRDGAAPLRPALVLPRRAAARAIEPICVGLVAARRGGDAAVLATLGDDPPRRIERGGALGGWRLDAIAADLATWSGPDGARRVVVVAPQLAAAARR